MLAAVVMSLATPIACANMLVYPMAASIGAGKASAAELRIYSKSDETQYVRAVAKRVIDPATDREREEGSMNSGDDAVVISPAKFALPAGGMRLVRVIPLGMPDKEVLYRVYLQPAAAPSDEAAGDTKNVSGTVDFSLVWAPLIRVLPKTAMPDFDVSNGALVNTGNVRIGLLDAGACRSDQDESSCRWIQFDRSVYPDQEFRMDGLRSAPYVRIRYRVEGIADVQQKTVRVRSVDPMNAQSADNEARSGHAIVSTNQKE